MPNRGRHRAAGLLGVAGLLVVAGWLAGGCRRPSEQPAVPSPVPAGPDIVLVTLDTTRADHLGCFGYSNNITPNLDGLAGESAVFVDAIASAAITPVSHASILTGLNPYLHGLRGYNRSGENRLPAGSVTLPAILKKRGYHAAAFVSSITAGSRYGLNQGFDTFDEDFVRPPRDIVVPDGKIYWAGTQRHAGETTDKVLSWLERTKDPYFLWVHYFDPHDPEVLPPPDYRQRYPVFSERVPAGSPAQRDQLRAIYDLEIQFMDQHVGRLLAALRARSRWANTILVVVADHGEGLGDHHWWTHGVVYQEQIRVALLVKAPGQPGGRRVDCLVRTIDLMPTILELAGIDPGQATPMEGQSMAALLGTNAPDPGLVAYAEGADLGNYPFTIGITDVKDDLLFSVLDRRWKYIHHWLRPQEDELYDLASDPHETRNQFADRADQVRRLQAELAARKYAPNTVPASGGVSPAEAERLRSLGYVK